MLLWRSDYSQKCPLPVSACSHRTAAPQDCNQVARALRPYTNTRAKKESAEEGSEMLWEDQALLFHGSTALLGFFLPPPLHTGTHTEVLGKDSKAGSRKNKTLFK